MRFKKAATFILTSFFALSLIAPVSTASQVVLEQAEAASTVSTKVLGQGTSWKTTLYVIKADKPGPTVWISGGIHGNEPAGYKTALEVKDWKIDKGTLIVLPEANKVGIVRNRRDSGFGDLNRDFPMKKGESADNALAKAIWKEYQNHNPAYLLDLHEGIAYHVQNKNSVGQSIIYYPTGTMSTYATNLVSMLNKTTLYSKRFSTLRYPILGSLARAAGIYGSKAAIFETCSKDALSVRLKNQRTAVTRFLNHAGMSVVGS
ncbi:M99 family carboxypeptidase catalytic domain-containing protein [Heliophilum fasciatum]|uniref:Succinylglutamate desuccinylase/aspartoacylase family protein n=1 Tax=Heliophilum fasciatum TaxID=35700 RepID=A0A4R2RAA2_9FIRM|nr:succinylglutamate desuccinylase/aspartoacylase family protein [Heliophilum fasciatum]MCW2279359.1 putative deacylase [Heliophilum fasciatum]TCP60202.1 succinylglutamate desuccinylase/aspartoacylase family protein [Heliophilum fasciatum]